MPCQATFKLGSLLVVFLSIPIFFFDLSLDFFRLTLLALLRFGLSFGFLLGLGFGLLFSLGFCLANALSFFRLLTLAFSLFSS